MFETKVGDDGVIRLCGRCDAASTAELRRSLTGLQDNAVLDFSELTYISSDPIGELFAVQKRLLACDKGLTLVNLSPHIREVFRLAGFDTIFSIEDPPG